MRAGWMPVLMVTDYQQASTGSLVDFHKRARSGRRSIGVLVVGGGTQVKVEECEELRCFGVGCLVFGVYLLFLWLVACGWFW
jgi:hypothetical protein